MPKGGHKAGAMAERRVVKAASLMRHPLVVKYRMGVTGTRRNGVLDKKGIDVLLLLDPALAEKVPKARRRLFKSLRIDGERFLCLPIQVKNGSGRKKEVLAAHYRRYPCVLAVAVNGYRSSRVARHLDNLFRRLVTNLKIPLPGKR